MNYSRNISAEYIRKALTPKSESSANVFTETAIAKDYCYEPVPTSIMAEEIILKNESGTLTRKLIHFCFVHKESLKRMPIIGAKLVKIKKKKLESGRKMIDVSEYLPMHYSQFIPMMYKILLNREPDSNGLASFVAMAKNGASNGAIIYVFAISDEFANRAAVANLKHYKKLYKKYLRNLRIKNIPILGRLVKIAALPSQLSTFSDNYEYYNGALIGAINSLNEKYNGMCSNIELLNRRLNSVAETSAEQYERMYADIDKVNKTVTGLVEKYDELYADIDTMNKAVISSIENYDKLYDNVNRIKSLTASINDMTANLHTKSDGIAELITNVSVKEDALPEYIYQISQKSKTAITGVPGGVISVIAGDFIFGVPSEEWGLAHYLSLNGHFEKGTEEFFCNMLRQGANVLDIGANLGIFTLHALKAGCNVYSFEPSPSIFRILNQNIKVNGYAESGMAHTFQNAVSDEEKTISFYVCDGMSGHSNMYAAEKNSDTEIKVNTVVIDKLEILPSKIDVVKIDVEGAEYSVLVGMQDLIRYNPQMKIIIEFAPENIKQAEIEPTELLNLIKKLGFEYYLIDETTGKLEFITEAALMQCFSVNLLLTKEQIDL